MSQKKVDEYKASKKNRAQEVKKEKLMKRVRTAVAVLVAAAFVIWFGWSVYGQLTAADAEESTITEVNMTDFEEYYNGLTTTYGG